MSKPAIAYELITTTTRKHAASVVAQFQIDARLGLSEVDDGVALTIASWYAGHDASGKIMAQLSTTGNVVLGDLLDAITAEYSAAVGADRDALDMLATWGLHHSSRI